jgi:WD40 repeat protein
VGDVDLHPPVVVQKVGQELPKISKDLPKRNKKLEEKKGVGKVFYSQEQQRIVALGTLSSSIFLYDKQLRQQQEVRPRECRDTDKEVGILSMAYCEKQHRIGAILTSGTLVFWEGSDQFATQKDIPLKQRGDKVFYLPLLEKWLTADSSTLYFWNLKEETVSQTIRIPEALSILDLCELDHLKSICVSVLAAGEQKLLAVYQQGRRKATIDLGSSGCHSLHYNRLTQSLVPLGYSNVVPVYSLQGQFDAELQFVLRGHKSIITCVDSLGHNTLMATGDDTGEIRIWELSYMRCVQSIKLAKWLGGIRFVGEQLLYTDSRVNLLQLEHFLPPPPERETALQQHYDPRENALWIFTKKDVRKADLSTGRISSVFVLCAQDDELSAAVQIGDGFVVGNSRGELQQFNSDCNLKWQRQAHEGEVRELFFDPINRLIFSLGTEGKVVAWPERNPLGEQERKSITFRQKQVNFMLIAPTHTLLLVGHTHDRDVTFWNYEVLNLLEVLRMDSPVTAAAVG